MAIQPARPGGQPESAALYLSEAQREEAWDAFEIYDIQKQGKITKEQFKIAFKSLGYTVNAEEYQAILFNYFTAKEWLEFPEFLQIIADKAKDADALGDIGKAFKLMTQGRSQLTMDDLDRIRAELGKENVTRQDLELMIRLADTDGKGSVQESEFYRFMQVGKK